MPRLTVETARQERGSFAEGKTDGEIEQVISDIQAIAAIIADMLIHKNRQQPKSQS